MVSVRFAAEDWRSLTSQSWWKQSIFLQNYFLWCCNHATESTKCTKLLQIWIKVSSTFLTFKILEYKSSVFQAYHTILWSLVCGDHCKCHHIPSYHIIFYHIPSYPRVVGMGLLSSTNIFIFIFVPKFTFKIYLYLL